jgi:hypothetical protein
MNAMSSGFGVIAFGISGANTSSPFDPNPSLPSSNSGNTYVGGSPSVTASTSNSQDFIMGFLSTGDAPTTTITPGFTPISNQGFQVVEYKIVTLTQTNLVENYTLSNNEPWIAVADAVKAGSSSSPTVPVCITLYHDLRSDPIHNSQTPSPNYFTVTYRSGGLPQTSYATDGTQVIQADPGTTVTVSGNSSASSNTEQWCLAITNGACNSFSFVSAGPGSFSSITLSYYDLLSQNVSYSILDGGSPTTAPTLTYTTAPSSSGSIDNPVSVSLTLTTSAQTFWALRFTSWSVSPNPLPGSSATERWYSNFTFSGTISSPSNISPTYYHQYYNTFTASVANGGKPLNSTNYVILTCTNFGVSSACGVIYSGTAWTGWTDSSAVRYSLTSSGSSSNDNWSCSSGCILTPTSGGNTFSGTYIEQGSSTSNTPLADLSVAVGFAVIAAVVLTVLLLINRKKS